MAIERLKEVVDHELSRAPGESRLILARDIVRVAQLHALLTPLLPSETSSATRASLTSWVEGPGSKIGHALATFELPKSTLQPHIEALFFTVDREEMQLIGQRIGATILHPEKPIDTCVDDLKTSFDRDELETISRILEKGQAIQAGYIPKENALDSCVFTALADSDDIITALAAQFPHPTVAEVEICPSEITLLPDDIVS